MFERTIETSAAPHITVAECQGNLVVQGVEEQQITLRLRDGDESDVTLEQEGESFTLTFRADCFLTCPLDTTLNVRTVARNLKIKEAEGALTVDAVRGNVTLRGVGPATLGQVFGNLDARRVAGDLQAQSVKGNAHIYGVEGSLSLGQVSGNARVREVEASFSVGQVGGNLASDGLGGGLSADQVGGNVRLGPPFSSGASYHLKAGGNLRAYLPSDASLRLALRASGIRSHVPDLTLEEAGGEARGTLGAGEADLEARVSGNITLNPLGPEGVSAADIPFDFGADLEGFGLAIEGRIAEAMAGLEARLHESLGSIDSERLRAQVERATEQTMRAAERAAERVRRKAEREAERARIQAERAERRWQRVSGHKPRPRREPVTSEEQLRILRMVEEGKLTPEQAADLLAALNGR